MIMKNLNYLLHNSCRRCEQDFRSEYRGRDDSIYEKIVTESMI